MKDAYLLNVNRMDIEQEDWGQFNISLNNQTTRSSFTKTKNNYIIILTRW